MLYKGIVSILKCLKFFFREHTGELCIFVLRRKKGARALTTHTHTPKLLRQTHALYPFWNAWSCKQLKKYFFCSQICNFKRGIEVPHKSISYKEKHISYQESINDVAMYLHHYKIFVSRLQMMITIYCNCITLDLRRLTKLFCQILLNCQTCRVSAIKKCGCAPRLKRHYQIAAYKLHTKAYNES
jgi:hypothetical protein